MLPKPALIYCFIVIKSAWQTTAQKTAKTYPLTNSEKTAHHQSHHRRRRQDCRRSSGRRRCHFLRWRKWKSLPAQINPPPQAGVQLQSRKYSFSQTDKEIYYYLTSGEIWVNCGIDPISEDMRIRPVDWEGNELIVRGKDLGVSLVHRLMSF